MVTLLVITSGYASFDQVSKALLQSSHAFIQLLSNPVNDEIVRFVMVSWAADVIVVFENCPRLLVLINDIANA